MNWTLFWQIAGPIIGVIGIGVMVVLFLLPRRERVKIKFSCVGYRVDAVTPQIKVYWGGEFLRSGGRDVRYIKQILLGPDKQKYNELCKYFKLPKSGLITINEQLRLPRDVIVSSYQGGEPPNRPVFRALPELPRDAGQRDKAQQIASTLSQSTHKIGLVWDDTGKTTWKKITPNDYNKWV